LLELEPPSVRNKDWVRPDGWSGRGSRGGPDLPANSLRYQSLASARSRPCGPNVDALATQFRKPIIIAETQYPWTLANGNNPIGDSTGDFVWQTSQLSPGCPASPGGQLCVIGA
jgi:hypothetical protein